MWYITRMNRDQIHHYHYPRPHPHPDQLDYDYCNSRYDYFAQFAACATGGDRLPPLSLSHGFNGHRRPQTRFHQGAIN